MNTERISQLADDLDKVQAVNPHEFNMSNWGYGMLVNLEPFDHMGDLVVSTDDRIEQCGTAGCIAGWATLLYGEMYHSNTPSEFAQGYLGLNDDNAHDLFMPNEHEEDMDDDYNAGRVIYAQINAGMAAKVLRHLATTGDVDWNQAYS